MAAEERIAARKEGLLRTIEHLSKDDADRVCLALQIIPREDILDPDINPQRRLRIYVSRVTTLEECITVEKALQDRPI